MTKKRNELEIIRDLLVIAKDGSSKTGLVYKGNLNFKIIKGYLEKLSKNSMILRHLDMYFTTKKGLDYIEDFNKIPNYF